MAAKRKTALVSTADFLAATEGLEERARGPISDDAVGAVAHAYRASDAAPTTAEERRRANQDFAVLKRYQPWLRLAETNPTVTYHSPERRQLDILAEAGLVERMPPFSDRPPPAGTVTYMTAASRRTLLLEDELRKLRAKFE